MPKTILTILLGKWWFPISVTSSTSSTWNSTVPKSFPYPTDYLIFWLIWFFIIWSYGHWFYYWIIIRYSHLFCCLSYPKYGYWKPFTLFVMFFQHAPIIFFFFWLHLGACGILVPRPETEHMPPALGAQCLNHRMIREVPLSSFFDHLFLALQNVPGSSCSLRVQTLELTISLRSFIFFLKKIIFTEQNLGTEWGCCY